MTASPPPECPRCGRADCRSLTADLSSFRADEDLAKGAYAEYVLEHGCDGEPVDWFSRAKAAKALLVRYGKHDGGCNVALGMFGDCDCGFKEARGTK